MNLILDFLSKLKENNNRDWFQANRSHYEQARKDFEIFLSEIIAQINRFDNNTGLLTPQDCVFRIYRDIRFSPNKLPYKGHFGAYIAPGGRKSLLPGYYIHIEPGASFAGGGMYQPPSDMLKKIRQEIYFNAGEMLDIVHAPEFIRVFGKLSADDALKRPPRDFPKDFQQMELLMFRSYIASSSLTDEELLSPGLSLQVSQIFKTLYPLNRFLNRAIEL